MFLVYIAIITLYLLRRLKIIKNKNLKLMYTDRHG